MDGTDVAWRVADLDGGEAMSNATVVEWACVDCGHWLTWADVELLVDPHDPVPVCASCVGCDDCGSHVDCTVSRLGVLCVRCSDGPGADEGGAA